MKKEIIVPSLGESITEATVGEILVATGSSVKMDQEVLELETDKVNQLLYAPIEGKILLTVKSGERVKIGQSLGVVEAFTKEEKESQPIVETSIHSLSQKKEEEKETVELHPREDPLRYTADAFLKALHKPSENGLSSSDAPKERETRKPMSRIRKVIADRLVEAQKSMAMLTTFNEVDMSATIELREKYKEAFLKKEGVKLGFMSFFVKAVVSALEAFPAVNSYIEGDEIVERHFFDIGVAVGTDRGVIVPVIRDCNHLSYAAIEKNIEVFAKKAREGHLQVSDLQGGGFTITNGGVYGSLLSTPIIVPPQCAILGMHKIEKRPVVIQDQIIIRQMMYLALSYDHRLIDGKEAVSFLVHIKNVLEEPAKLLLGI